MPTKEQLIEMQIRKWYKEKEERQKQDKEKREKVDTARPKPVVALYTQKGAGGSTVARRLAETLGYKLFDREIVDYISKETKVRREIIESLDETTRSAFEQWVEGILRRQLTDSGDYFRHLVRAVTAVAQLGSVVIVGRGSGLIVPWENCFRLGVVAPKDRRVTNLIDWLHISASEAVRMVESFDRQRRDFVQRFFARDIDDSSMYDLVINTRFIKLEEAHEIVFSAFRKKFP